MINKKIDWVWFFGFYTSSDDDEKILGRILSENAWFSHKDVYKKEWNKEILCHRFFQEKKDYLASKQTKWE